MSLWAHRELYIHYQYLRLFQQSQQAIKKGLLDTMEVINNTRKLMKKITAELTVQASLKDRLPPSYKYDLRTIQAVRVYREGSRLWEGHFNNARICDKKIWSTKGVKPKQFDFRKLQYYRNRRMQLTESWSESITGFKHSTPVVLPEFWRRR